jgi:hypothetical protein
MNNTFARWKAIEERLQAEAVSQLESVMGRSLYPKEVEIARNSVRDQDVIAAFAAEEELEVTGSFELRKLV